MRKINAVIRKNYGIDPLELTDKEWATIYQEHLYLEKIRLKQLEIVFSNAIAKVFNNND